MKKTDRLFIDYLVEVNTLDIEEKKKRKLLIKNVDIFCIRLIGFSVGVITIKVMIEQLIMQLGVYLK